MAEHSRMPVNIQGDWLVEGTEIRVADLQNDLRAHGSHASRIYQAMGLSPSEYQIAKRFKFPAQHPPKIDRFFVDIVGRCECGTAIRLTGYDADDLAVGCVCGRLWEPMIGLGKVSERAVMERLPARPEPARKGQISIDQSIVVRVQHAYDRWVHGKPRSAFESAMQIESSDLGGSIPNTPENARAFRVAAKQLHDSGGNGAADPAELLQLVRMERLTRRLDS
jgi:hypothetical protein